jgi:hypothetical protein
MPLFHAPTYSKVTNPKTGVAESCYTFAIEYTESDKVPSTIVEEANMLTISALEQILQEKSEWMNGWIRSFFEASAKHFSKPYTVQHIYKIMKHRIMNTDHTSFPANVSFYPTSVQIYGGIMWIDWKVQLSPIMIDIPDLPDDVNESLPVSTKEEIQEMNIEEVPVDTNATDIPVILEDPTKLYERNKVKEARMKAKLAMYRAQYQMNKYYEKYGTDVTDSDTSDEEDSGQEIQL